MEDRLGPDISPDVDSHSVMEISRLRILQNAAIRLTYCSGSSSKAIQSQDLHVDLVDRSSRIRP